MELLEQEIIDKFQQLAPDAQARVLDFLEHIRQSRPLSALEIMQLPIEERQKYVQSAIASATNEDFEIFEAYSEEALDE